MIKNYETMAKENGYWLSVLRWWDQRGIDLNSNYANIVNGITPQKVSDFIKKVLASGNKIEVVMMPEE